MNISSVGIASIFDNFTRGLQTGRQLKQVRQENELEDVRRQGLDAAKEKRKSQVAGMVEMQGLPTLDASNIVAPEEVQNLDVQDASALPRPETQGMPKQPEFKVGDQVFGSKKEAEQHADTLAPPVDEIFYQQSGPKMRETLIAQGRLDEAQNWQKFMDEASTRKAMEGFRTMARRRLLGDHEGAAKEFMKIYNSSYVNDGSKAVDLEMKVGQDGSPGIAITFEEDGKKFTRDFGEMEDFYQLSMAETAPQKMFDFYGEYLRAEKVARREEAAGKLDHERKKELELLKSSLDGSDVNSKYAAKVGILRNAGFSQEEINRMTPKILGAATERAGMSEVDIRAKALAALKDSFEFQGASEPEQKQMLSAMVGLIRGDGEGGGPAASGGKTVVRTGRTPDGRRVVQYSDGTTETR